MNPQLCHIHKRFISALSLRTDAGIHVAFKTIRAHGKRPFVGHVDTFGADRLTCTAVHMFFQFSNARFDERVSSRQHCQQRADWAQVPGGLTSLRSGSASATPMSAIIVTEDAENPRNCLPLTLLRDHPFLGFVYVPWRIAYHFARGRRGSYFGTNEDFAVETSRGTCGSSLKSTLRSVEIDPRHPSDR